jgi:ABC-2 type transport system ATP-binding protein
MIQVENLTKQYGEIFAIKNLSFSVRKGEILGFLGPNGAGKTTTMRIITGYIPPTDGRVVVGGFDVVEEPLAAKRQIGYLPENPPLYNEMSVEDYLGFVAEIRGVERRRRKVAIEETMEKCGVGDVRRRLIGHLSRGYRQRVGIAQALIHNPSILILDEPTVGLDPRQIIEIRELIHGLAGMHTVILSTHLLQEVSMTCTRVVIINEGKIALEESMSRLSKSQDGTGRFFLKLGHTGGDISEKLSSLEGVVSVSEEYPGVFIIETDLSRDIRKDISKTVVLNGWALLEFRPMRMTLEDVFLKAISTEEETA